MLKVIPTQDQLLAAAADRPRVAPLALREAALHVREAQRLEVGARRVVTSCSATSAVERDNLAVVEPQPHAHRAVCLLDRHRHRDQARQPGPGRRSRAGRTPGPSSDRRRTGRERAGRHRSANVDRAGELGGRPRLQREPVRAERLLHDRFTSLRSSCSGSRSVRRGTRRGRRAGRPGPARAASRARATPRTRPCPADDEAGDGEVCRRPVARRTPPASAVRSATKRGSIRTRLSHENGGVDPRQRQSGGPPRGPVIWTSSSDRCGLKARQPASIRADRDAALQRAACDVLRSAAATVDARQDV